MDIATESPGGPGPGHAQESNALLNMQSSHAHAQWPEHRWTTKSAVGRMREALLAARLDHSTLPTLPRSYSPRICASFG